MKPGDLVAVRRLFWQKEVSAEDDIGTGMIVEIVNWVDSGAPDRNFGTTVSVLWQHGVIEYHDDQELEVVNENYTK